MKQLLNRVRDWLIRKLGGVPRREAEEKERLVIELHRALDACRPAPAVAVREEKRIVPIKMREKLYGFEEQAYFPECALQEIHNLKRELLAREIGSMMLDKGLLKVRINRNMYSQQVDMELYAEVVE